MGDPVALDQFQAVRGVEPLHDHAGRAARHRGHVVAQRRGVIERRGRQIDHVAVQADRVGEHGERRLMGAERHALERPLDRLGPPGGAGRIEHVRALDLVGDPAFRLGGDGVLVGGEAVRCAADHQAVLQLRAQRRHVHRNGAPEFGRNEQPGAAVVDDVSDLAGGEVRTDRRVIEPGPLGAPAQLEEARMVLDEEGDVVAGADAERAQQPGEAVRARLQFRIGHGLGAAGHDERGLVGRPFGEIGQGRHGGRAEGRRVGELGAGGSYGKRRSMGNPVGSDAARLAASAAVA